MVSCSNSECFNPGIPNLLGFCHACWSKLPPLQQKAMMAARRRSRQDEAEAIQRAREALRGKA